MKANRDRVSVHALSLAMMRSNESYAFQPPKDPLPHVRRAQIQPPELLLAGSIQDLGFLGGRPKGLPEERIPFSHGRKCPILRVLMRYRSARDPLLG